MKCEYRLVIFTAFFAYAVTASAQDITTREAALFDKPVSKKVVLAKLEDNPSGEITCTYFPDLMIKEIGTDSPTPDDAIVVRTASAPCSGPSIADGFTLATKNHSFIGKKGAFLFFGATDPNGAIPFVIIEAASGKIIYSDGKIDPGFRSVEIESGKVHIRFRRAFNASCSILKDGASCWSRLLGEGKIPRAMAQSQPTLQACVASYSKLQAQPSVPSMIVYDVDMNLEINGKSQILSRGQPSCLAIP